MANILSIKRGIYRNQIKSTYLENQKPSVDTFSIFKIYIKFWKFSKKTWAS